MRRVPTSLVAGILAAATAGCASQAAARNVQPPKLQIGAVAESEAAAVGAPAPRTGISVYGASYVLAGPLPDHPTHAQVWRWDSEQKTSQDDVARLARGLGISNPPQRHAHGWVARSASGELRVRDGGSGQWAYVRADRAQCAPYMLDVDQDGNTVEGCAMAVPSGPVAPARVTPAASGEAVPADPGLDGSASSTVPADPGPVLASPPARPATPPAATRPPAAPGPDDATTRAAAHSLLQALGVAGAEQVLHGTPGTSTLLVSPTIGSLPTLGIEINIDVDARGVSAAHGLLEQPRAGDDYPLRTAKSAFDALLHQPRPMIAECAPVAPSGPAPASCQPPPPTPITGAKLGLQARWDATDQVLVPAWFFTVEGWDQPVAIVAIDSAFIADVEPTANRNVSVGVGGGVGGGGTVGRAGGGQLGGPGGQVAVPPAQSSPTLAPNSAPSAVR